MSTLAGTGGLIRLILRLERIRLPVWTLVIAGVVVLTASSFSELYPDEASRAVLAGSIGSNPSLVAFYGPIYDSSIGGLVVWRLGIVTPMLVGLLAIFTVVRHTRGDEETGRRELLGSTVVGRHAPLAAALAVTLSASLLIGALMAAGLIAIGLPLDGSAAFGLATAAAGWTFAALAGVSAQLTESARTANAMAVAFLGAVFVVRIAGDSTGQLSWLVWLSPLGWAQRMRPFADERWWIVGLFVAAASLAVAAAFLLSARRDVGAGILPPRHGPATASPRLRSPLALALRLHRGLLIGWTIGFAVFGVVIGAIGDGVTDLLDDNPQLREIFEQMGRAGTLVDLFFSTVMGMAGLIAAGYAIQATLRLRSEEVELRAEPVLATAVGRIEWATSHLVFGLVGPVLALVAAGLTTGIVHGLVTGDVVRELPRIVSAATVQLPAVWVVTGIALALFGLAPRLTAFAWVALVLFLLLGQLGELLELTQILIDLSPFTHVPQVPAEDLTALPLALLLAVAGALIATGLAGFRRRDVL